MTRQYRISVIMGLWVISLALGLVAGVGRTETIWLSSLDLSKAKVTDQVRPAIDKTINGNTLTINKLKARRATRRATSFPTRNFPT